MAWHQNAFVEPQLQEELCKSAWGKSFKSQEKSHHHVTEDVLFGGFVGNDVLYTLKPLILDIHFSLYKVDMRRMHCIPSLFLALKKLCRGHVILFVIKSFFCPVISDIHRYNIQSNETQSPWKHLQLKVWSHGTVISGGESRCLDQLRWRVGNWRSGEFRYHKE